MEYHSDLLDIQVVCDDLDHPECITVGPDGILWAGGEGGQIYRIDAQTRHSTEITCTNGFILGVTLDGNGNLYCCDSKRKSLIQIDCETGIIKRELTAIMGRPLVNPNYAVFDSRGWLYVSDSGHFLKNDGFVFALCPDGSVGWVSDEPCHFPNGLAWSSSRNILLVVESTAPGYAILSIDGTGYRMECELPGTVPDGIALTQNGEIYVACYRPDTILRIKNGKPEQWLYDSLGTILSAPTNICFGGVQNSTLYIASLGRWHIGAKKVDTIGQQLMYPNIHWES